MLIRAPAATFSVSASYYPLFGKPKVWFANLYWRAFYDSRYGIVLASATRVVRWTLHANWAPEGKNYSDVQNGSTMLRKHVSSMYCTGMAVCTNVHCVCSPDSNFQTQLLLLYFYSSCMLASYWSHLYVYNHMFYLAQKRSGYIPMLLCCLHGRAFRDVVLGEG